VRVEIFRLLGDDIPHNFKAPQTDLSFEKPIFLYYSLTEILEIRDTDKVVIINGSYRAPNNLNTLL
jgi:hypothetical protein